MSDSRWYFTEEQLANSPSRKCGINAEQELSLRQRASNLIQDMGQRLQVSQLCINTAIVYMHRFYAFHSFTLFHRNSIAAAAFFLAAKVEEQPRKLEHVIKILNICLDRVDNARESYAEQAQELVFNENVLLQTLGFDVAIDHPHTHVVRACNLFNIVTVSRELRQTCYFMASNSLHLTTMCLKYKPTVVAAFCIYIACKWSRWEIPNSCEGKAWYTYVDDAVTPDILKKLTDEYLGILEKSPSKFKSKMKTLASNGQAGINQNPSVNARDEPVHTPNQKTPHDKQHHHHHHHNSRGTGSSSSNNVRKQPGELSASASASATSSSSSSSKQPQQSSSISAYKNQAMPQPGMSSSSNSHLQRQRPSSSSSSQQAPYPGNTDNSSNSQKAISEERTSHRQIPQETSNYGSSCQPRPIESHSKRLSSNQTAALGMQSSSSSQPQLNQHQPPHQKPTNNDQRHSQSASSKAPIDYHQKSMKHPQSTTSAEMHARSSSSTHSQSQQQQQQPSPQMKKPSWTQQQLQQSTSQPQNNLPKQTQSHVQSSHSQPNLTGSSSSSSRNNSQALPSYSESQKQLASQPSSQNDFWYNDKIHETTAKPISPIRQGKSMFSPSPDHDKETYDKRLLMMTSHVKRNESPKSDKQDRRTTTPNKREKKLEMQAASSIQKSSTQVDRKPIVPKLEPTTVPTLAHDPNGQMKKRPFSAIDEQMSAEFGRDSKARKVEIKSEPNHLTGSMMKQPIETNPDIVKSLLQECYTVNKFDSFGGMDSPLDVMNTEPTNTPSLTASTQPKTELNDASILKMEPRENGYEEEHHKRNKSKKSKKEKHKHKKKKSHKSDREDREDRKDSSLKTILSVDSKSSPENSQAPRGLKIKIPIKDVNKSELVNVQQLQLPPAPLKLKLSKEKFGGFSNSGVISDGSSSSSSHKKKEKDKDKERSKSKSSKHGNNNNIPEYKDVGYHQQPQQQHQQLSMNKMSSSQVSMPQNHQMQQQNSFDASMSAMFGNQQYQQQQVQQPGMYQYPQQQQQMMNHPQQSMMNLQQQQQQSMMNLQQQQFQNYNYQPHPAMNNYSTNGSNSGKK